MMKTRQKKNSASGDNLKTYFSQIKKTPLLSFEEECELSRRIQGGDAGACAKLVEANLRLVIKIARGYMQSDVDIMDLIQEGNIGLLTAAGKYDHSKRVRFCTYAAWWIKQGISRFLTTKRRHIRLPYRKDEALRKIQKAKSLLSHELQRAPSVDEISRSTGLGRKEVVGVMSMPASVMSLDARTDSAPGTLYELYEDYTFSPEKSLMKKAMAEDTRKYLETLARRERQVLLYRFSFYGNAGCTLKDVSSKVGVSPETVRQMEIRAMNKIRAEARPLAEYVLN
ncbi:MAG: RNA polymerase sigma factor RpoD/SigA [Spirochaetales bacterium]|jgi:RNA polymerase primary sigma factor|nr:RNA polymerase sigma factor RpoD/SigA [Spirochaetales bacterium]